MSSDPTSTSTSSMPAVSQPQQHSDPMQQHPAHVDEKEGEHLSSHLCHRRIRSAWKPAKIVETAPVADAASPTSDASSDVSVTPTVSATTTHNGTTPFLGTASSTASSSSSPSTTTSQHHGGGASGGQQPPASSPTSSISSSSNGGSSSSSAASASSGNNNSHHHHSQHASNAAGSNSHAAASAQVVVTSSSSGPHASASSAAAASAARPPSKPSGRFGHTVVVAGDEMILFAGRNDEMCSDLWKYNFSTSRWTLETPTSTINPPGRAGHTATLVDVGDGDGTSTPSPQHLQQHHLTQRGGGDHRSGASSRSPIATSGGGGATTQTTSSSNGGTSGTVSPAPQLLNGGGSAPANGGSFDYRDDAPPSYGKGSTEEEEALSSRAQERNNNHNHNSFGHHHRDNLTHDFTDPQEFELHRAAAASGMLIGGGASSSGTTTTTHSGSSSGGAAGGQQQENHRHHQHHASSSSDDTGSSSTSSGSPQQQQQHALVTTTTTVVNPHRYAGHQQHQAMIVFGGAISRTENSNDVWMYDPVAKSWTLLHPGGYDRSPTSSSSSNSSSEGGGSSGGAAVTNRSLIPRPRRGHTACLFRGSLIVFGGCEDDRVWRFDPKTRSWSILTTTGPAPPARMYHVAEITDDAKLVLFGGMRVQRRSGGAAQQASDGSQFLDDVVVLSLQELAVADTMGGDAITSARPLLQQSAALTSITDSDSTEAAPATSSAAASSGDQLPSAPSFRWEVVSTTGSGPTPRMCMTSFYDHGALCVVGGGSTRLHDECYELDTHLMKWRLCSHSPTPCTRPTIARHGNQVLLWGGCKGSEFLGEASVMKFEPLSLREACRHWMMAVPKSQFDLTSFPGVPQHLQDVQNRDEATEVGANQLRLQEGSSDETEDDQT